jgi:hypothetical protein
MSINPNNNLIETIPSLFPSYHWVTKDLALLILDKGSDEDVGRICQANRAWHQFVQQTPALHCRLVRSVCVSAARAFNLDEICLDDSFLEIKLNALFKIAKIDPESDLEAVKKEALEGCLGLSLLKIIRWEAMHNLAAAKKTSLRYAGRFPYLLREIVKVEAETDPISVLVHCLRFKSQILIVVSSEPEKSIPFAQRRLGSA